LYFFVNQAGRLQNST